MARHYLSFFLWIICLTASTASSTAWSEEEISLSVQPNSGTTRDSFLFGITIENPESNITPTVSETSDFSVRYVGPQQSVQIINGSMRSSVAYFYRLTPKHIGTLKTPPVSIAGKMLENPSLNVLVANGHAQQGDDSDEILFEQTANPQTVYRGQQVLNTLEILTTIKLNHLQIQYTPITSFWTEELTPAEKDQIVRNGTVYTVIRSHRALFPLKSGSLIIPERRFSAVAERGRLNTMLNQFDPFDPNFVGKLLGNGDEEVSKTAEEIDLTVLDLPEIPPDLPLWSAAEPLVGDTSIAVKSDKLQAPVGGTFNVSVTLESTGNLNPITKIEWPLDKRWKIYQEQPRTTKRFEAGKIIFTKVFNSSFIPASGGDLEIPPLSLGYFDPSTKKFNIAKSDPIEVTVNGPIAREDEAQSTPEEESSTTILESQDTFTPRWLVGLLVALLVSLFIYAFLRKQPNTSQDLRPPTLLDTESVASIKTLHSVFIDAIRTTFPKAQSAQSIRAGLKEALLDSPQRFEIESLLDEIEEALFGSQKIVTEDDFQRLKANVFSYLTKWGIAK